MTYTTPSCKTVELAASKPMFLMMMIACFASGTLAILLAFVGGRTFMLYSIPGFIIGGFFAYKYATFDKKKARQEEHKRKRNRH